MFITGVVLTGGKSSRMGTDKGLKLIDEKPMVQWLIDLLKPLCDEVVISANSIEYQKFGYTCVSDKVTDVGPIGGMFTVMNTFKSDYYFFVSCDIPKASSELGKRLLGQISNKEVVVPQHSGGKTEPLFGVYRFDVRNKLKKQIDRKNYKLMDLLHECNTYYYEVPDNLMQKEPNMFKNYNTPKDFE